MLIIRFVLHCQSQAAAVSSRQPGSIRFAQVQRFPEFVSIFTLCWSKQESELSPGPNRKLQTQNSAWALEAGAFWKAGVFGGRDLNSCVDNTDNRDLIQAEGAT